MSESQQQKRKMTKDDLFLDYGEHRRTATMMKVCMAIVTLIGIYYTITGRGAIAIVQGVCGILFAIEGFWMITTRHVQGIKRTVIFLLAFSFTSLVISIVDLLTINIYCDTVKDDPQVLEECEEGAKIAGYVCLCFSILILPMAVAMGFFAREQDRAVIASKRAAQHVERERLMEAPRNFRQNASAKGGYAQKMSKRKETKLTFGLSHYLMDQG